MLEITQKQLCNCLRKKQVPHWFNYIMHLIIVIMRLKNNNNSICIIKNTVYNILCMKFSTRHTMSRHTVTESEHQYLLQHVSTHNTNATLNICKKLESEWPQKILTSGQRIYTNGHILRDIFIGENLMWHSSASVADKGIGGVACYVLSDLYTVLPFSIGTAEGSTVFTRWRQCAHPTITLFLKPTSQPSKQHLDQFCYFCTAHPLVKTPTGSGNLWGTCVSPSTWCTDHSIVYLQASKSMRKSTPYIIHSILTVLHYNRSIYSYYEKLHYKRSICSHYKINTIGNPYLLIINLHYKRFTSYNAKRFFH